MALDLPVITRAAGWAALGFGLGRTIALLAFVAASAFLLLRLSPIDPVDAYLGPAMARVGVEQKAAIAAAWGLDRPWPVQFLAWAGNLASGNLGFSITYNAPVAEVIRARIGPSLALTGMAWLLSGCLGFGLGILAALHRDRWPDRLLTGWFFLLASTPTFWLGMLALTVFSVELGWAPLCCAGPIGVAPDAVTMGERIHHLVLPLAVLTAFGVAQIGLHTRSKALDILACDYVLLARAQGAGTLDIVRRHVMRNAALPGLALLFASIGEIIGGAMLAEQVFAYPGIGRALVEAGLRQDVPLLLALTLLTAAIVASGGAIARFLARRLDPRLEAMA